MCLCYSGHMDEKAEQRFRASYVLQDCCWIWIRGCFRDGYGAFGLGGKTRRTHRVSYEAFYNLLLSSDQFLHHICRNKRCVNPLHLEITNQVDHVDGITFGNKDKTHCPHGHEYTPANICWNRGCTSRECRICKYARTHRRNQKIRNQARQQVLVRLEELALKCLTR